MRYLLAFLLLVSTAWGQLNKPLAGSQIDHSHGLSQGLVAFWPMLEGTGVTTYDLSGNGNTGTFVGGTHFVPGRIGPSLDFDGSGDYVDFGVCPEELKLESTDFTITAWINPNTVGGSLDSIIGNDLNTASGGWSLSHSFTSGALLFYVAGNFKESNSGIVAANQWTHIAITFDQSTRNMDFYVNGNFDSSQTHVTDVGFTAARHLVIGIDPRDVTGLEFDGQIESVQIYNRAITLGEIQQLFNDSYAMIQRDPLIQWAATRAAPAGGAEQVIMIMSKGYEHEAMDFLFDLDHGGRYRAGRRYGLDYCEVPSL